VLDIVGCGATSARTEAVKCLIGEVRFAIIKGNSGEIGAASGVESRVKGVESVSVRGEIEAVAAEFSKAAQAVVVVTGETDIVTNGDETHFSHTGHPLMAEVVGTGCMAASVLGVFSSVAKDYLEASVCAVKFYGSVGQKAAEAARTPVAFKHALMDEVYVMSHEAI
jgi:hydroxyethylthiazole kinase